MRNKDRIESFCNRLAEAWKRTPDLRFGQLIINAYSNVSGRDPFFIEDEQSIEIIEAFTERPPYYPSRGDGENSTDLIEKLREKAEGFDYDGWVETATLLEEAANAIEELSAKYEKALQDIVKEVSNAQK